MTIVIHFRVRVSKKTSKTSLHYIYCRLRINRVTVRSDMATGVSCLLSEWESKAQRIRGNTDSVREQNAKLEKFRNDLDAIYNELRRQDKTITAEIVKQIYVKKIDTKPKTLLVFYADYIKTNDINFVRETKKQWNSRLNTIRAYIENHLKRKDVDLAEVTPKFVQSYYGYHVEVLKNSKTHAARAVSALKAVLDYSVVEGALDYNSAKSVKVLRDKRKPIKYLTENQLKMLLECPFYDDRLQRVVDCFAFQTFTGLAYQELLNFSVKTHLKTDAKGIIWIMIHREKTKELSTIPFLASARAILEKYENKLTVVSNQKMNDFIKEAARIAGLDRVEEISTHVARKTAGMYFLNRGLRLETVSKILGHKSTKITERYYAELLTSSIADDLMKNGLI